MDNSATSWFSELGMEDPFSSDQCHNIMDIFYEDLCPALGDDLQFQSCLSPQGNFPSTTNLCASSVIEATPVGVEGPAKQHKPNNYNSLAINNIPNPIILSFGNPNMPEMNHVSLGTVNPEDDAVSEVLSQGSLRNHEEATKSKRTTKKTGGRVRPASQTYDHIIAERKRREQLSQQFVALSAIVPGLKKMDKTSVLGDAINYLKHLQERVKTLEEQATKQTMESVVLVKKSQLLVEDEGSSDEMGSTDEQPLPEIEAKVCDKTVLLRIQCEKDKWVLNNVLSTVEKLNLVVTYTSVAPFGSLALDITIIAEMEKEFNMTTKELVKSLQSALQSPSQAN